MIAVAKFADLSVADQGALSEYVTFNGGAAVVYIHWTARRLSDDVLTRRWVDISVRSGHTCPTFRLKGTSYTGASILSTGVQNLPASGRFWSAWS